MTANTKTAKLTANQTVILDQIRKGAGTDAEIGETVDMKLSAISASVRGLIKRGIVTHDGGRYVEFVSEIDHTGKHEQDAQGDGPTTEDDQTVNPGNDYDSAVRVARELQGSASDFQTTKAGTHAKVVTVGKAYVTTDGKFVTAKVGSDTRDPWVLMFVPEGKKKPSKVGSFVSSSAALALDNGYLS